MAEKLKYVNKKGVAKNIIMFLGDGMSLTTLTASRIYKGQMDKRSGEDEYLSFERFPFVGMSKVRLNYNKCIHSATWIGPDGFRPTLVLDCRRF